jgi:hypothetical protein
VGSRCRCPGTGGPRPHRPGTGQRGPGTRDLRGPRRRCPGTSPRSGHRPCGRWGSGPCRPASSSRSEPSAPRWCRSCPPAAVLPAFSRTGGGGPPSELDGARDPGLGAAIDHTPTLGSQPSVRRHSGHQTMIDRSVALVPDSFTSRSGTERVKHSHADVRIHKIPLPGSRPTDEQLTGRGRCSPPGSHLSGAWPGIRTREQARHRTTLSGGTVRPPLPSIRRRSEPQVSAATSAGPAPPPATCGRPGARPASA